MFDKIKQSYYLYHSNIGASRFKCSYVLELIFWFALGYYFHFRDVGDIVASGSYVASIADNENPISIGIKTLSPIILYIMLLGYTQGPLYNFLNRDSCVILYKMVPNSFEKFKHNLWMTYVIASVMIPIICILYMLLFYPYVMIMAVYEGGLMLVISALHIYCGLRKESSFLLWNMFTILMFALISIGMLVLNEIIYIYLSINCVLAIGFYVVCVYCTFRILKKIMAFMKGEWNR